MGNPNTGGRAQRTPQQQQQQPTQGTGPAGTLPPQLDPMNPANLGYLPGGGNQAVLDRFEQQGSGRRPLTAGSIAQIRMDESAVLAVISEMWDRAATWGDDAGEDPEGKLQEWGVWVRDLLGPTIDGAIEGSGLAGGIAPDREKDIAPGMRSNPELADCPEMMGALQTALSPAWWEQRQSWQSGKITLFSFDPMGLFPLTTVSINIAAYIENEDPMEVRDVGLSGSASGASGQSRTGTAGAKAGGPGGSSMSNTDAATRSVAGTGTMGTTMSAAGALTGADLIFEVDLTFERADKGKFGPITETIYAGRVATMGVGLG